MKAVIAKSPRVRGYAFIKGGKIVKCSVNTYFLVGHLGFNLIRSEGWVAAVAAAAAGGRDQVTQGSGGLQVRLGHI